MVVFHQYGGVRGPLHSTGHHGQWNLQVSGYHPASQIQVRVLDFFKYFSRLVQCSGRNYIHCSQPSNHDKHKFIMIQKICKHQNWCSKKNLSFKVEFFLEHQFWWWKVYTLKKKLVVQKLIVACYCVTFFAQIGQKVGAWWWMLQGLWWIQMQIPLFNMHKKNMVAFFFFFFKSLFITLLTVLHYIAI